jgi:WD40-like Beta Propeller Repeat
MVPCAPVRVAPLLAMLALATGAHAQLDPSAGWRTLHTPHFRIHFRPELRAVALREAREAERAYALLATELHTPRGIVDITLSDDVDAANGSATPFPSNRIVLYVAPPASDAELQNYDSWLRVGTTHELTHIFHLDRARRLWGGLQHVFGRVPELFPNQYQPTWVVEGLATYYESKFTNGGRVRGSFHTQVLASQAAGKEARSPWNALLFSRWPGGLAPYAYGSRFFRYIADSLGDSVIPRFAEATAGQMIPFRVGRPFARVTPGVGLEDAWPRGTRPAPQSRHATGATVLDRGSRIEPVPHLSPDGRRAAYVWDNGKGARQIRVVTTADWRVVRSRHVTDQVSYDWLGDTLVVSQLTYITRWRVRSDLYYWRPSGQWVRATHGARLQQPRTGGGRLATLALVPGANRATLLDSSSLMDIGTTWGAVVPSPDGNWVAATRHADGHWTLVRWVLRSPAQRAVLVDSRGVVSDPVWTPDGGLLFVSDQTGYPQVYRWIASGPPVALTAEPLGARAPAVLTDGTLLYTTLTASGWDLRRAPSGSGAAFPPPLVPPPFDSAPPVPIRETGYAAGPSLRPHFWIPIGLARGATGSFFGAVTGGTDAIGRYTYAVGALVGGPPTRAVAEFDGVSHVLGNPSLDWSIVSDWATALQGAGTVVSERERQANVGATFVRRSWETVASVRVAAEYDGVRYAATPDVAPLTICGRCADRDLIGGSVTLRLQHYTVGALAVSPEDGYQWSALYRRREEQGTARWSNELRSQLALYLHVPGGGGFAHHVLAARVSAGTLTGSLGEVFAAGGVSEGGLALGLGQSLGHTRQFPVRGFAAGELYGRSAATASLEYRIPIILLGQLLGHLPLGADKFSFTLFGDAGDAWNLGAQRLTRLRSVGAELVSDVTVNYDAGLRLRLGVAAPLSPPPSGARQRPRVYLALNSSF